MISVLDKNTAQLNGKTLGLPPVWIYSLEYKLVGNKKYSVVEKDNKVFVTHVIEHYGGRKETVEQVIDIDRLFNFQFLIYYDDPSEKEADRDNFVFRQGFQHGKEAKALLDKYGLKSRLTITNREKNDYKPYYSFEKRGK